MPSVLGRWISTTLNARAGRHRRRPDVVQRSAHSAPRLAMTPTALMLESA
jgi:hypothetical protein